MEYEYYTGDSTQDIIITTNSPELNGNLYYNMETGKLHFYVSDTYSNYTKKLEEYGFK